jgi:hypothetical protein
MVDSCRWVVARVVEGNDVDPSGASVIAEKPDSSSERKGFSIRQASQLVGRDAPVSSGLGHGGGHTTWTCRTCDTTVYGPPINTHCTTLDGPAVVRISNAT